MSRDDYQTGATYGQSVNLAAQYIGEPLPDEEQLPAGTWIKLVLEYADLFYEHIMGKQVEKREEAKQSALAAIGQATVSTTIPADAPRAALPPDQPPPPTEPPPEHDDPNVSAGIPPKTEWQFDPEGTTWQVNPTVACPKCNFPSQKWDSKWMTRGLSKSGKHAPAYRCGTHEWGAPKGPPLWGWKNSDKCDWVAWRDPDEYPPATPF